MSIGKNSVTIQNLEAAFAGESMARAKYMFFAKRCRELGAEDVAKVFEDTAHQETLHAFGHLDLLFPKDTLTVAFMLENAIGGETHECEEMYPKFRREAEEEKRQDHAQELSATLEKAAKRFAALAKVEERHANHYRETLKNATAKK